ncbi:MAG: DUF4037 domain-containing protein [Clostridia bacterium]|nr:DUF4037 domain-containing protein [Clostridia bacterium]
MKGLALARSYYESFGKEMLEKSFPDELSRIAVGLVGEGSECSGFDDTLSQDHDFEPGFCLWISRQDYEKFGFPLERAYAKLPKEFMGFSRSRLAPAGSRRHGVLIQQDFYTRFLGQPTPPDSLVGWLYTPSFALFAATNGEVWRDDMGSFTAVRDVLKRGYPLDVRKKKLAAHTLSMTQAGLYNYPRLLKRGERGAAQLAVFTFVKHAISAIYLLNNAYEPFYKWAYRGMRSLPLLSEWEDTLSGLCELDNSEKNAKSKMEIIELLCDTLSEVLVKEQYSDAPTISLADHAYTVYNSIKDNALRKMHILEGIDT